MSSGAPEANGTTNPDQADPDHHDEEGTDQGEDSRSSPLEVDFHDEDGPAEQADATSTLTSLQDELLNVRCQLAHASFAQLKSMAKCGLIRSRLANVLPPMCLSCQYGKATRRPWRTRVKPGQVSKLVVINTPGDCVSVDQLELPTPGFIGLVKGFLTMQRYHVATVFVDHYSGLGYICNSA
jgi:hypothetical protein